MKKKSKIRKLEIEILLIHYAFKMIKAKLSEKKKITSFFARRILKICSNE